MDISNEDALTHRIYDAEIVDITAEVSFIIICPSSEQSCSVPGQREILLQRGDLLSLPVQVRWVWFGLCSRKLDVGSSKVFFLIICCVGYSGKSTDSRL